jgi:hypothetical protein
MNIHEKKNHQNVLTAIQTHQVSVHIIWSSREGGLQS